MAIFLNPVKLTQMVENTAGGYPSKNHFFIIPTSGQPKLNDQVKLTWTDSKTNENKEVMFYLESKAGVMVNGDQLWKVITEKEWNSRRNNSEVNNMSSDPLWAEFLAFKQFKQQFGGGTPAPQIPLPQIVSPSVPHPTVNVPVNNGQMTEQQARANARVLLGMPPYGPGRPSAQQLKLEGLFQAGALDPVFTNYAH